MRRLILLSVVTFLLNACQTTRYEGNEDSPYYQIPAGSRLILRQDVEIPPHRAGVYLQGGQIKPLSQVNQYYPHCKFEVLKISDIPQTVHTDRFTIEKVVQEITDTVDAGLVRLAGISLGMGIHVHGDRGDGANIQTFATRLKLRSEKQPEVFRLSCGQSAYPYEGQHVSIKEIRRVLGDVFTLEIIGRAPASRSGS